MGRRDEARGHQITRVSAIAMAFALGATCSPGNSNEGIEFLAHHQFEHDPHGTLGKTTQVLVEDLLLGQDGG